MNTGSNSSGLAGAGGPVDDDMGIEVILRTWGHILGIFVVIVRVVLQLAQEDALHFCGGAQVHHLLHLPAVHPAGGAVGGVREDVKAPGVPLELVAGKPVVALLGDKADHQDTEEGDSQAGGTENRQEILYRISDPDGFDLRGVRRMKGGGDAKLDGIDEHSIEIPAHEKEGDIRLDPFTLPGHPAAKMTVEPVLQLFDERGQPRHEAHLLPG